MKTFTVYTITYNGEVMYVGKTSNMAKRKSMHKTQLGNPKYSAIPVDADLNKVKFNVVAEFDNKTDALKYEDQLILKYNTIDNGWNTRRSGLIKASDMKTYMQDYRAAHSDELRAYDREYNAAHKEEKAAYNRDYNAAHKEDRAAYYEANREHIRAQQRDYRAAHRDEINAKRRERRARKKAEAIASAS